jgi:small subunit ribosomal protein S1
MTKDNREVMPSQSQDTPEESPEQTDVIEQPSLEEPESAAEGSAETSNSSESAETSSPAEEVEEEVEVSEEASQAPSSDLRQRKALFDEEEYSDEEYEDMLSMYEDTLKNIEEGEIVKAKVLRVTDSAAILDLGFKSEGSVPLEEFRAPDEVEPGQEVDVFLEKLEDNEGVVVLSKKKADFLRVWEQIKAAYDADEPIGGVIKKKVKGGVTVDIMGVDAFLPGSQVALRRVPNVDDLVGQEFDFKILKLNKRRRNIVVSRRVILEQERSEKREELKTELEVGQLRKGIVKNITDFGAFIDLGGMDGLLHITDMSWGRVGHPSELCSIGDEIEVKILDIDWDRERISLGLKQLEPHPWKDVEEKYPVGGRVRGKVVSITNYGAFVELERGVEGLVHISEMSWTRNVRHPSQLVSIGDEIEAVVLKVDPEEEKISLGMKQAEEDPWLNLPEKYPPGTRIRGKVRNLTSFGAFVEVEPGIDGLVHVSDMSWTKRIQHPSEVLKKGDEVEVVALSIDVDQKRISLGLKQTEDDPWYQLAQTFAPGTETTGTAVRLLDKGIVVDLGEDVEGFVPVSQIVEDREIHTPADVVKEGDKLQLKVMESDPINRRIVLQVTELPERVEEPETEETAEAEAEETEASTAGAEAEETAEAEAGETEASAAGAEAEETAEAEDVAEEPQAEAGPEDDEALQAEEEASEEEVSEEEVSEEEVSEEDLSEEEVSEEEASEAEVELPEGEIGEADEVPEGASAEGEAEEASEEEEKKE